MKQKPEYCPRISNMPLRLTYKVLTVINMHFEAKWEIIE
jgi:hypothetical protein